MTPAISEAIDEIKAAYPAAVVTSRDDGSGGAFVTVDPVDPGEIYNQRETRIGFQITFQYPYSDVYPLFVRPDLSRVDGQQLGEGMSLASFDGKPALQISRKSNRLNPDSDTAEIKLMKVLEWLRHR